MPPNVRPIWTPQDSIDVANQFALELDNAERGRAVIDHPERSRLFSVSRERRARRMDALAVGLLMLVMALIGMLMLIASTPQAKADDSDAYAYAAEYGSVICDVLDQGHGTIPGLMGVLQGVEKHSGLSAYDAGKAVGWAVAEICPRHMPLLRRFVASVGQAA